MHVRSRTISLVSMAALLLGAVPSAMAGVKVVSEMKDVNCYTPRWSPDGKRLAYEYHDPKKDYRGVDIVEISDALAPKGIKHVEPDTALEGGFGAKGNPPVKDLTWHPQGRGFVYSSTGGRHMFNIYMDGEGNLTGAPAYGAGNKIQPTFSKDGRYLAFSREEVDGGDIFMVDIFNLEKGPVRMTETEDDTSYQPRFSPDGKMLLFTRMIEKLSSNDLFIITDLSNPKGSTKKLTDWKGDELNASFSPDGKWIALFANRDQKDPKLFDLWIIHPDGTGAKKLATDVLKPDRSNPVWTPDSKRILFVKRDNGKKDPIAWVMADDPKKHGTIDTSTLLNNDLDLFVPEGGSVAYLAFTAQGKKGDKKTRWKRVYVTKINLADMTVAE